MSVTGRYPPVPRISVIIPTYNRELYLGQAVESVLAQSCNSHEIIIVDDGSTDETPAVLQPYAGRIRYLYQDNRGQAEARNHGLRLAQGEFVVFLDSDDFFLPGKLAEQLACFEAHPSLGVVHSGWYVVNAAGERLRKVEPWHEAPHLDLKTCLLWKPVSLGAMMFRRHWLERIGGFDTCLRMAEDVDLLLRLSLAGCKMTWLRRPVVCYRKHDGNATQDAIQDARSVDEILGKFFARPDVPREVRRLENNVRYHCYLWHAWRLFLTGHTCCVAVYLRRSLSHSPDAVKNEVWKWVSLFTGWLICEGYKVEELHALLPHFKAAVGFDGVLSVKLELIIKWWTDVWWHYLQRDFSRAAQGLETFRGLAPAELFDLARGSILISPAMMMDRAVTQFWRDVGAKHLVPVSCYGAATAVYLALFWRLVISRQWDLAAKRLRSVLQLGFRSGAATAWGQLVRVALSHCKGRFTG